MPIRPVIVEITGDSWNCNFLFEKKLAEAFNSY